MGGFWCICRGCFSKTGEGISLFTLPRDRHRAETWLRACNREDLLMKNIDWHKNFRVCEKHFEEKYIAKGGTRKTLFAKAIPTIFEGTLQGVVVIKSEEHSILPDYAFR